MALLIWTADTHLQDANWKHFPHLRGDAYYSFQQVIDYAKLAASGRAAGEVAIAIGGDIFQLTRPSSRAVIFGFGEQMRRLYTDPDHPAIPVYYIQGQHEKANPPWASGAPNAQHIDGAIVEFGGLKIYGLDHRPEDKIEEELGRIPNNIDILILHQKPVDVSDFGGDMDVNSIPSNVKLVLIGDYHKKYEISRPNCAIISSGNTYMRAINEDHEKYFVAIDTEKLSYSYVRLKTRNVKRWRLETDEDLTKFIDYARDYNRIPDGAHLIDKPIWDVRYDASVEDVKARVTVAAEDKAFLFAKSITDDSPIKVGQSAAPGGLTLEEAVTRRVDPDDNSRLFGLLCDLLNTDSGLEIENRLDLEESEMGLVNTSREMYEEDHDKT